MNNLMRNAVINIVQSRAQQDPEFGKSPIAQEFMQCLQNGDDARGAQLAQNLCQNYGMNPNEAMQQASSGLPGLLQKFGFRL